MRYSQTISNLGRFAIQNFIIKYFIFVAFVLFTNYCEAQVINCNEMKSGVFQFKGFNGAVYTIIRKDSTQLEKSTRNYTHSIQSINWKNNCIYTLSNNKIVKGKEIIEIDSFGIVLTNEIFKYEKPNKYFVKTYFEKSLDTIITEFQKIDTSLYVNNIFNLDIYSEFKNSKTYGQRLLGENHSIDYYKSKLNNNKFLITFATFYQGADYKKTRLLDSKFIKIEQDEKIANSNCKYKNEFDAEICVVYKSTNTEQETLIIKAFRFNRKTEKIDDVSIKDVQYKERK